MSLSIRPARPDEAGLVLSFVRELAEYEKLLHEVEASEADMAAALFGPDPKVFCDIAEWDGQPAGNAEPFATGFLPDGAQDALGRPAGLAVGADGALYVSDDKAGFIYRIARR